MDFLSRCFPLGRGDYRPEYRNWLCACRLLRGLVVSPLHLENSSDPSRRPSPDRVVQPQFLEYSGSRTQTHLCALGPLYDPLLVHPSVRNPPHRNIHLLPILMKRFFLKSGAFLLLQLAIFALLWNPDVPYDRNYLAASI